MKIGLLSAPSNLGLRPPAPTSVPGCAKAPEALREAGLHRRLAELGAEERGVVLPGRYADDAIPGSLRNHVAIIEHARRLAERIDLLRAAAWPRWCSAESAASWWRQVFHCGAHRVATGWSISTGTPTSGIRATPPSARAWPGRISPPPWACTGP